MTGKNRIKPGEQVGLKLPEAQRGLLLESLVVIPREVEEAIRSTPPGEPLLFSLDELDDLAGHVAAAADHAVARSLQDKLDRIYKKIVGLLDAHTDEPESPHATPLRLMPVPDETGIGKGRPLPSLHRRSKGETYSVNLTALQRASLIGCTRLPRGTKGKIGAAGEGTNPVVFAIKELERMCDEIDISLRFAPAPDRKRLSAVLDSLDDLDDGPIARGKTPDGTRLVYQFKATLKDIEPPIWRRFQVLDCTLGGLHEVLQVVFGWQDFHLHQLEGERAGPPARGLRRAVGLRRLPPSDGRPQARGPSGHEGVDRRQDRPREVLSRHGKKGIATVGPIRNTSLGTAWRHRDASAPDSFRPG